MTQATPAERAAELLAKMTTLEKVQQLTAATATSLSGEEAIGSLLGNGIGQIALLQMAGNSPQELAAFNNAIQGYLVNNTRLGIPAILHNEALSGLCNPGYTVFPTAIGLAATWNTEGVREMTDVIRRQMRSIGQTQAFSPVVDVARDARWGRVHETYGEDVLLNSAFGVDFVRGIQGDDLSEGVIATAKHFLGYAASEGALNTAGSTINARELYDVYATPFEAMIRVGGMASIMNSYADVDGVPAGANPAVLTELLRERIGFTGTVVSDYGTTQQFVTSRFTAADPQEAGILALTAGLDVELPTPYGYGETLVQAIEQGLVDEALVDRSVLRVLEHKFALGLFENPYVSEDPAELGAVAAEGAELSRALAAQSITLLKNDGILPLPETTTKIAVIGPNGDSVMASIANYTYPAMLGTMQAMFGNDSRMEGVDILDDLFGGNDEVKAAIEALLSLDIEAVTRASYGVRSLADAVRDLLPDAEVTAVAGTGIVDSQPTDIPAAVRAAEDADVVLLAIGGRSGGGGRTITEGEGTDAARVELPQVQVDLTKAVAATGTPLVGVVFLGKGYALGEIEPLFNALVAAFYPGPQGAPAVADVLFGRTNPGGKLPITLPRATGQVPIYYSHKNGSGNSQIGENNSMSYIDLPASPLYPFGHGLSYTTFEFGEVELSAAEVDTSGAVSVTVPVTNTGDRSGEEVVQVYFRDTAKGVSRPVRQLVGFTRVGLAPGETAVVTFEVEMAQLGYTAFDGRFVIEPGPIRVEVGASSADARGHASFDVVGEVRDLTQERSFLPRVTVAAPAAR